MIIKKTQENETDELIGELVDALGEVDLDSSDAEANATTITDNNGQRIELTGEGTIARSDLNQSNGVVTKRVVKLSKELSKGKDTLVESGVIKSKLSKYEVAERQLRFALLRWFNEDDNLAIHTVLSASTTVMKDLCSDKGVKNIFDTFLGYIREERVKEFISFWNKPQNFLKHADRDPNDSYEFDGETLEMHIFVACDIYESLFQKRMDLTILYKTWFAMNHPDLLLPDIFKDKIDKFITEFGEVDKKESKSMFLDILQSGKLPEYS